MRPITIVDYGMGNIGSVINMFRRIGVATEVASDRVSLKRARKLLLPGVGAFDAAMQRIADLGIANTIRARAAEGTPVMGICLGMQLLVDSSEEGTLPGLGIIPGTARRLPAGPGLKVPHMGWNVVHRGAASPLTQGLSGETRFYFVHTYGVQATHRGDSILTCDYGVSFDAAIQRGNTFGAQFHPEKSHRFGMAWLRAFAELPC